MEPTKKPITKNTVTRCILNAEVSSENDPNSADSNLKGGNLINNINCKVVMVGYDESLINCPINTIIDLASTVY